MAALTDEQRGMIDNLFRMADFRTMYDIINETYKSLAFTDKLTDAERISEYKYITQQLRKYMSTHQGAVYDCGGNLDQMLAIVVGWLSDAPEYGDDRKNLVYNFLRDSWLIELYNGIRYLIDEATEEVE